MATFALGGWGLYDKDGSRSVLDLLSAPDGNGYFQGSLNSVAILGHWDNQTNEIAWEIEGRRVGPATLNPGPFYKGQGFPPKIPIQYMAGSEEPSQLQILMAGRLGLPAPTSQPWLAIFEGPIPG